MDNLIEQIADEYGIHPEEALEMIEGNMERKQKRRPNQNVNEEMYKIGAQLGRMFGGDTPAPKGALAALLSGLDANISIK